MGARNAFEARSDLRLSLRRLLSFAAWTGLVPPPSVFRPYGVSAVMTGKNEEDWVETSLLSIVNLVDEVIVADHGSEDSTAEIMETMAGKFPKKIRFWRFEEESFPQVINTLIESARYQWIFRFHSDFIARSSGKNSVQELLRVLGSLDPHRYFSISHSGIVLEGDLEHQFLRRRDDPEPIVFRWCPWLRFGVKERWESLHVPWFYEKLWLRHPYYFHMGSVKSDIRILQSRYWSHWFDAKNKGSTVSLRGFIAERGIREFGGETIEEAAKRAVLLQFQGCIPYSREESGEYPDILFPALRNPPFRLVFEDGKLVDRVCGPRYRPLTEEEG
jgi:hypothetical protein